MPARGGGLLGFAAFKDLQVSLEEGAKAEVSLDIQDLWVVPKRATRDTDIEDAYGVGLEDEDENSENEDLDRAGEGAGKITVCPACTSQQSGRVVKTNQYNCSAMPLHTPGKVLHMEKAGLPCVIAAQRLMHAGEVRLQAHTEKRLVSGTCSICTCLLGDGMGGLPSPHALTKDGPPPPPPAPIPTTPITVPLPLPSGRYSRLLRYSSRRWPGHFLR